MSMLAQAFSVIIERVIVATVHGKEVLDTMVRQTSLSYHSVLNAEGTMLR